jgi:hypothetical protein
MRGSGGWDEGIEGKKRRKRKRKEWVKKGETIG